MNIATVVEGPSDHDVIEAIINRLLPGNHRYFPLQPIGSANEIGEVIYAVGIGAGWDGVKRWCNETWQRPASSLETILESVTNTPIDLLILHVDTDIVREKNLQKGADHPIAQVNRPCPPIQETIENLTQVMLQWLNRQTLPPQVIFMFPAQDTENWTFAALYPNDPMCQQDDYECLKTNRFPGYLLTLKEYGKRLKYKDGKVKKSRVAYQSLLPLINARWETVCQICSQAQNFSQDILNQAVH